MRGSQTSIVTIHPSVPIFSSILRRATEHRLGLVAFAIAAVLAVSGSTRLALLLAHWRDFDHAVPNLLRIFAVGFLMDAVTALYLSVPLLLWAVVLPQGVWRRTPHRLLTALALFLGTFVLLFVATAEYLFWDEFGARFNFIAVDYLVYNKDLVVEVPAEVKRKLGIK